MELKQAETHRRTCKTCGYVNARGQVVVGPFGPHWGKICCAECGSYWDFVQKPDGDPTKYRREPDHKELVRKYGQGFCEMCLRTADELPPQHGLCGHHVVEYQNGGDSSRANTWILCTACHRQIHLIRVYWSMKSEPAENSDAELRADRTESA